MTEVIPITDVAVQRRIQQTFRIAYIKDVMLAAKLDENTAATLHHTVY